MAVCSFFGGRQTPENFELLLQNALIDLIENNGVDLFYISNETPIKNLPKGSFSF